MSTESIMFLIAAVAAGTLLYLHLTRNFKYWKIKGVPYVKPILFFGNIFDVFMHNRSMSDFLYNLHKTTKSPFLGFFVFDQPFLLIRDLELIKSCLIRDFDHFNDRSVTDNQRDDKVGSNILLLLKNPAWKEVREKITPAFATGKIRNMLPLLFEIGNDLVDYLNRVCVKEKSSDAREISMKYSIDVITSCGFGIKANSFKYTNAVFRETTRRFFDLNWYRKYQLMCYFFAPFLVKLFKMKFLETIAGKFLLNAFWQSFVERERTKGYKGDFVDVLIKIKNKNNNEVFDNNMIAAQAVQLFLAGFETTGSAISFALYELALNSSVQNRLKNEMQGVLENHEKLTYDAIQEMNYLDMTVKETLRKYPVLAFLDRRCMKSYKIPGTEVVIEKGIPIYISLYGLHYDAQYFPDPEKFDPERFSHENISNRHKFCYMPFGEGPRHCIGAKLAVLSVKVALIHIVMNFKIELGEDCSVPLKLEPKGFTLAPEKKLNLRFKRAG